MRCYFGLLFSVRVCLWNVFLIVWLIHNGIVREEFVSQSVWWPHRAVIAIIQHGGKVSCSVCNHRKREEEWLNSLQLFSFCLTTSDRWHLLPLDGFYISPGINRFFAFLCVCFSYSLYCISTRLIQVITFDRAPFRTCLWLFKIIAMFWMWNVQCLPIPKELISLIQLVLTVLSVMWWLNQKGNLWDSFFHFVK